MLTKGIQKFYCLWKWLIRIPNMNLFLKESYLISVSSSFALKNLQNWKDQSIQFFSRSLFKRFQEVNWTLNRLTIIVYEVSMTIKTDTRSIELWYQQKLKIPE